MPFRDNAPVKASVQLSRTIRYSEATATDRRNSESHRAIGIRAGISHLTSYGRADEAGLGDEIAHALRDLDPESLRV